MRANLTGAIELWSCLGCSEGLARPREPGRRGLARPDGVQNICKWDSTAAFKNVLY